MATIKDGLFTYLTSKTEITSLVGTKIFPNNVPNSAELPYVAVSRVSSDGEHYLGGASKQVTDVFELEVYGRTSLEVEGISEAIRDKTDGFKGLMGSTEVGSALIDGQSDVFIVDDQGKDKQLFRISITLNISHFRSVPTL